MTANQNV